MVKEGRLRDRLSTLPTITREKLPPFSMPQFLQLYNRNGINTHLIRVVVGIKRDNAFKALSPVPGTE